MGGGEESKSKLSAILVAPSKSREPEDRQPSQTLLTQPKGQQLKDDMEGDRPSLPKPQEEKENKTKESNPWSEIDDKDYKQKFPRIGIGRSNKITFSSNQYHWTKD